jgi:tetratricopeptide (TPR) repeat protein
LRNLQALAAIIVGYAFSIGGAFASSAPAQGSPQRELTVVVVNAHDDPAQPVEGIRVSLSFVTGSEKVVDARDATNRAGHALLLVSPEAAQRGDLRIEVTGASDLVVFEPADGQLAGLPVTLTLSLLPKGSAALLGPVQIEATLHRLSLRAQTLQQQNQEMKGQLAQANEQKADLTASLTEWAKANGFDSAQVDTKVREWAEDIEGKKEQATLEQKGLAELALEHYGVAAETFEQAFDRKRQALKDEKEKYLEGRRKELSDSIAAAVQASNTYDLNSQFHKATQIFEEARDAATEEHGRFPDDAALRNIWLNARWYVANAQWQEAEVTGPEKSHSLLAESLEEFQSLSQAYDPIKEKQSVASLLDSEGLVLREEAARATGDQAPALSDLAVKDLQKALEMTSKSDDPKDWAGIQDSLGNAFVVRGDQVLGDRANVLYDQAIQAFKNALELFTKSSSPKEWASVQHNLGAALEAEGERAEGDQANLLLSEAVEAYQNVLTVRTKASFPQDWAMTQNNLGIAWMNQADKASGDKASALLEQASKAFKNALDVLTRDNLPQYWAVIENNLGLVLRRQAEKVTGDKASGLFDLSIEASESAQQVQTKTDLPQQWARTEFNLGNTERIEADTAEGAKASALLDKAEEAYNHALEVQTKADLPHDWARTEENLGIALVSEGQQATGDKASAAADQAMKAFGLALEVYSKSDLPSSWATVQFYMGRAYELKGAFTDAASADESYLEINPADLPMLKHLSHIDHELLFRFDRALELDERRMKIDTSTAARLDVEEASLTAGDFAGCIQQAAGIHEADSSARDLLVRDTLKLACQWGAGQKAAAGEGASALLPKTVGLKDPDWEVTGTLHLLASSPVFERGRAAWIALFDGLQKGDGIAMANSLHELEKVMRN